MNIRMQLAKGCTLVKQQRQALKHLVALILTLCCVFCLCAFLAQSAVDLLASAEPSVATNKLLTTPQVGQL
jgi:hypothetical protein